MRALLFSPMLAAVMLGALFAVYGGTWISAGGSMETFLMLIIPFTCAGWLLGRNMIAKVSRSFINELIEANHGLATALRNRQEEKDV